MKLFVTIGSTRFDELIHFILQQSTLEKLFGMGVDQIRLQCGLSSLDQTHFLLGKQSVSPSETSSDSLNVELFQFKPEGLTEDFVWADLVVSHAGSGSILEGLRLKKKMVVVINDKLMDNHQAELAHTLNQHGYCLCCSPSGVLSSIQDLAFRTLAAFPSPKTKQFKQLIDEQVGFIPTSAAPQR